MGKKRKQKEARPKRDGWRKTGRFLMWCFIVYMILFQVVGTIRFFGVSAESTDEDTPKQTQVVQKENVAVGDGAQTFAKNFMKNYFKWEVDSLATRAENLAPFLREGVDKEAGLRYEGLTADSIPGEVEVVHVEDTGENTSLITVHVTHYLETEGEKDKKEKTGPFDKYVKVPVVTDGKGFLINEIPTFTSEPGRPALEEKEEQSRTASSTADRSSIEKYLPTFFKVYSTGTAEELEYYTDDLTLTPLGGSLVFSEIESFKVYDGKGESFDVSANVIFTDEQTKGTILQKYELNILQKDSRWIIQKLN